MMSTSIARDSADLPVYALDVTSPGSMKEPVSYGVESVSPISLDLCSSRTAKSRSMALVQTRLVSNPATATLQLHTFSEDVIPRLRCTAGKLVNEATEGVETFPLLFAILLL